MNVLTIFEQRIGAIFEEGAPGTKQPFSFKRLAKRMVREMEDATFVIDGVDTAPALYTVLVSQADDYVMRPLYIQITDEISQLIEAQAKKRGYTFVGRPLVRFMVDPGLRNGRFSVFAENIDNRTRATQVIYATMAILAVAAILGLFFVNIAGAEGWVNVLARLIPWTRLVLVGTIALIYSEYDVYE
jgi:hypothetical protein